MKGKNGKKTVFRGWKIVIKYRKRGLTRNYGKSYELLLSLGTFKDEGIKESTKGIPIILSKTGIKVSFNQS